MASDQNIFGVVRTVASMLAESHGDGVDKLTIIETMDSEFDNGLEDFNQDQIDGMVAAVEYLVKHSKVKVELPYLPIEKQTWRHDDG